MSKMRWQDWVTLLIGVWVGISPWVLGYSTAGIATANAVVFGIAIVVYSIVELSVPRVWEEWLMVLAGVWLLISPWVLQFSQSTAAAWDTALTGIAVGILALWAMAQFSSQPRQREVTDH